MATRLTVHEMQLAEVGTRIDYFQLDVQLELWKSRLVLSRMVVTGSPTAAATRKEQSRC